MRKIFVALIIIFVVLIVLVVGLFFLRMSFGRICTLVGCIEGVTIIADNKFSDDISVLADGEVLIDLCQFNKTERVKYLDSLYVFSGELKPEMRIRKENPHKVDVWQIMIQPNCIGQKQLLYEIEDNDVEIKKNEPNGPGCGTCQFGTIDLSS